jgi:hypothetical protein
MVHRVGFYSWIMYFHGLHLGNVPWTSVLMGILEAFQVTIVRRIKTCLLIPWTAVLVGILETVKVTIARCR